MSTTAHLAPRAPYPALVALLVAAFATPVAAQTLAPVHTDPAAIAAARADSAKKPYTTADIAFVGGMTHHHAQAIVMAKWAPTHGASPDVRILCGRIINAQLDEIHRMQQWLADRGQPIVSPQLTRDTSMRDMPGMHEILMPGMLTDAQLDTLDSARGEAFDRLFLTYMIQHHNGAVQMVQQLFSTYGAGQDETIFKMASDINVDQRTEIDRMHRMLVAQALGITPPPK